MPIILGSELSRNVGNKLSIKQRHIHDNNKLNQNKTSSKQKLMSINRHAVL
jgi:hypothetical protein